MMLLSGSVLSYVLVAQLVFCRFDACVTHATLLLFAGVEVMRKASAADNGQPILAVQLQPPEELFPEARQGVAIAIVVTMAMLIADLLAHKKGF